jgi:hypothetical protein
MRPSLRHYIAVAFIFAATVPVIFLGLWLQRSATENEFLNVNEKHVVIARSLSASLGQYASDLTSTFPLFVQSAQEKSGALDLSPLATSLKIRGFTVFDGAREVYRINGSDGAAYALPPIFLAEIAVTPARETITFHQVMEDQAGRPTIFMSQRLGDGRIAIAAIGTEYFELLRAGIEFGARGHAAIVDQTGHLIAHPKPEWRLRDISQLTPVRRMRAGETGAVEFYSPAAQKDMVAGYATVPATGWGVMVPQPVSDLLAPGEHIQLLVIAFVMVGLIAASILGWLLSKIVAHQIERIIDITLDYAEGGPQSAGLSAGRYAPVEFRQLTTGLRFVAERKQQPATSSIQVQANDDWPEPIRIPANTP